jgi:hypothetical protein
VKEVGNLLAVAHPPYGEMRRRLCVPHAKLYEIKNDAYRALGFKDGRDVRLVSRNKKAFDYPQLLDA